MSALVGAAAAYDDTTVKFFNYLSHQNKSYISLDEFNMRLAVFTKTDDFIEKWNANGENTSNVGHNYFSDMTSEERFPPQSDESSISNEINLYSYYAYDENQTVPTSVNWVNVGVVTNVQNQGSCFGGGSAYAAAAALSASLAIQTS